jgi:DNA-binding MarR family transcriptional regulator
VADYDTSGMNRDSVVIHVMTAADPLPEAELRPWRVTRSEGPLAAALRQARPDLLLLDADRVTPDLAAFLEGPEFAEMPLVLLAGDPDAEAAGLLLDRRLTLLDRPPAPGAIAAALHAGAAEVGRNVADAGSRYGGDGRLEALKRDADRVAAALAELTGARGEAPVRAVTAARIRAHIKARRQRERFLDPALFADAVWDILLDLAASRLEERPVSVSSLCIAASVPTTTALRTIKQLVDRGLLHRRGDPSDARRTYIGLSAQAARAMDGCLEAVLNQPGQ